MGFGILTWIKIGLVLALLAAVWAGYAAVKHTGYKEAEAKYVPMLNICTTNFETAKLANDQLVADIAKLREVYKASQDSLASAGALTKDAIKVQADALLLLAGKEKQLAASKAMLEKIANGPPALTKETACEEADRISLDYARRMRSNP